MKNLLYALPSIILIGGANVILKWRVDVLASMQIHAIGRQAWRFAFDPFVLMGACATAASILWWLNIMPQVKISIVYPLIQAGAIVVTLLLSMLLLQEKLEWRQAAGMVVLVAGIIMVSQSKG